MRSRQRTRFPASVQDWFFEIIEIGHDRTVRLVLETDGRVDHARLTEALRLVRRSNPIIDCRFVPWFFYAHWQLREDRDSLDLCRLVESDDPQADLDAFLAPALDPHRDPLVQIRIVRAEADTVCIKLCHVLMDGGGFKLLVQRLIATYRDLGAGRPPDLSPLPSARSQGQVLKTVPARGRLRAFLTQPFHKKSWSFPYGSGDLTSVSFPTRTVGVPLGAIRDAARRQGASITDAIVTAFSRAVFETTPTPVGVPLPFTLAIDLRRYLAAPDAAGLANLSSLVWVDLVRRPGAPIEEALVETHDALDAAMSDLPGVGLAEVMQVTRILGYGIFRALNLVRASMARRQGREFPSLSNIGPMDPAMLSFGDARVVRAKFFGVVVYPPTFCVVSGSYLDSLYFTASYPRDVVPGDLVEALLDRMVVEIESLCRK
jgi:NRPS condensation-like uncharacterized protein